MSKEADKLTQAGQIEALRLLAIMLMNKTMSKNQKDEVSKALMNTSHKLKEIDDQNPYIVGMCDIFQSISKYFSEGELYGENATK